MIAARSNSPLFRIPARLAGAVVRPALLAMVILSGCCATKSPQGYFGPTLPMSQVVEKINENNGQIQSLWAHVTFGARITDPDTGKTHTIDFPAGDGSLLYLKPNQMRLTGSVIMQPIFEFGSTQDEYWASILIDQVRTQWWGHYRNLGKPCSKTIPIRPDLLMEVLGVSDLDTNFDQPPVPVMRFNNEQRSYMLLWAVHGPNHWIAQREVWYDVETYLPKRILLYDDNGRVILRAALSDHEHLSDDPKNPMVATRYNLFFPDSKSEMTLKLSLVQAHRNGFPKPGSIRRRPDPDLKIIQLDEDCEESR